MLRVYVVVVYWLCSHLDAWRVRYDGSTNTTTTTTTTPTTTTTTTTFPHLDAWRVRALG